MRGDKILVQEEHRKAAVAIVQILLPLVMEVRDRFAVSIGGESGSGKSELALALKKDLAQHHINSVILQQDDYFVYPPKTNHVQRQEDINRVGTGEVRLVLLDRHVYSILNGARMLKKPLVIYRENLITNEVLSLDGAHVVLVEGTYTTVLKNVHQRVFIDRMYKQTLHARRRRDRESFDPFLEQVLKIEHGIICKQKLYADIVVTPSFRVIVQEPRNTDYGIELGVRRKEVITGKNHTKQELS